MGFTPADQRHPKGSDDCSSRVMQVPLQSLGRRVAPPGDDSSHPKGGFGDMWANLEIVLLFCWQQRAPGRERHWRDAEPVDG